MGDDHLIVIGFRATDYIVVEIQNDLLFIPKVKLSGTIDDGVINLHQQIKDTYKELTGGSDLNEYHLSRISSNGSIRYKGKEIDFTNAIQSSKNSITTNIADRLKSFWVVQVDLFNAIFIAGSCGKLFEQSIKPHFDNLLEVLKESHFANTIGYLRLDKKYLIRLNPITDFRKISSSSSINRRRWRYFLFYEVV